MLLQTLPDQYTKIGQIKTRFWASGDTGPPVILVHGIGGSVEAWRLNIGALAEHYRVYLSTISWEPKTSIGLA
jgi:pimeloyl-ACP methyl ester carboxylesterase